MKTSMTKKQEKRYGEMERERESR
jgi:hypothetical protein